jgi:hypothetical protein
MMEPYQPTETSERPRVSRDPIGFTYFIQTTRGGPVKIGCTQDYVRRLAGLQTGAPAPLIVLGVVRDATLEPQLHTMFAADHVRGE